MRRFAAFAVSVATLVVTTVSVPAVAATSAAPASIAWGPCTDPSLVAAGGECGFLSVPLDYGDPTGRTIQLAVGRVKHKVPDSQFKGVVLTNPGGPGAPGLFLAARGSQLPDHAGDAFDWIGFDPRGVGTSKPALSCDSNYFAYARPGYVPTTPQLEQTWRDRTKTYAENCAKKNDPALLANMKTTDTVRDMDSIRAALGMQKMDFYGYSYGTYLGEVYGTMFPSRIDRMILDSTVDPRYVWYESNLDQDAPFDRNLDIWFGWLARYEDVYHLGKTQAAVKDAYDTELRKLSANPAGGIIGPDEVLDVTQQAGYYQLRWPTVADAFAKLVDNGDSATFKGLFDKYIGGGDDNNYAAYLAVQCTDVQWPLAWHKWRVDNWLTYAKAPYTTWGNAWYNAPCVNWPAKPGKPVNVDGSRVQSVLMIDETLDAATPYEGSLEVRSRFPGARLIAEPGGTSHAITPRGNACVDDQIADYLLDGTLPPRKPGRTADAECAPLPEPVPATPATSSTRGESPAAGPASPDLKRADVMPG